MGRLSWAERLVSNYDGQVSYFIKGFAGGIVKDLSGKHPVSALMEVCSKRRWGQPEFTLLTDPGAGNNRSYLYKVQNFFIIIPLFYLSRYVFMTQNINPHVHH